MVSRPRSPLAPALRAARARPDRARAERARALALALAAVPALALLRPAEARGAPALREVEARAAEPAELLPAAALLAPLGPARYASLFAAGKRSTARTRAATDALGAGAFAVGRRLLLEGGEGLALAEAPLVRADAERARQQGGAGAPRDAADHLARKHAAFAEAAGLGRPPAGRRPIYAETRAGGEAGVEVFDGRSFAAGFLLAVELAGAGLEVEAGGRVLAGAADARAQERAFEALCHLYGAAARLDALVRVFASDGEALGPVELDGYDPYREPRWLAARAAVRRAPGAPLALRPLDRASDLEATAYALLACCRLVELLGPGGRLAPLTDGVRAGDRREEVCSRASLEEARRAARFLYRNLVALHFDPAPDRRRFAARADDGVPAPGVRLDQAGLALEALARARALLQGEAVLFEESRRILEAALDALVRDLAERTPAGFGAAAGAAAADPAEASPGGRAALSRGLLAALAGPGEGARGALGGRLAQELEDRAFVPDLDLYLSGGARVRVDPVEAATVLAWLADAGERLDRPEAIVRLEVAAEAFAGLGLIPDGERGAARVVTLEVAR